MCNIIGKPKNFYDLDITTVDQKSYRKIYGKEEKRQIQELDFKDTPDKLKGDYLDMYERIQSEVISTTRFDENSDLSTTYLGKIDTTTAGKIKADDTFPISEKGYMIGKIIRWSRMSDTIGYWSKQIIYVYVTLFVM